MLPQKPVQMHTCGKLQSKPPMHWLYAPQPHAALHVREREPPPQLAQS